MVTTSTTGNPFTPFPTPISTFLSRREVIVPAAFSPHTHTHDRYGPFCLEAPIFFLPRSAAASFPASFTWNFVPRLSLSPPHVSAAIDFAIENCVFLSRGGFLEGSGEGKKERERDSEGDPLDRVFPFFASSL